MFTERGFGAHEREDGLRDIFEPLSAEDEALLDGGARPPAGAGRPEGSASAGDAEAAGDAFMRFFQGEAAWDQSDEEEAADGGAPRFEHAAQQLDHEARRRATQELLSRLPEVDSDEGEADGASPAGRISFVHTAAPAPDRTPPAGGAPTRPSDLYSMFGGEAAAVESAPRQPTARAAVGGVVERVPRPGQAERGSSAKPAQRPLSGNVVERAGGAPGGDRHFAAEVRSEAQAQLAQRYLSRESKPEPDGTEASESEGMSLFMKRRLGLQ